MVLIDINFVVIYVSINLIINIPTPQNPSIKNIKKKYYGKSTFCQQKGYINLISLVSNLKISIYSIFIDI